MKRILLLLLLTLCPGIIYAAPGYDYQLYKNGESFGIVVFPRDQIFPELDRYIQSLVFEPAESGKAVMRFGTKGENETYMMPLEVQKKHGIEKFIVVQVLTDNRLMIGIYDPEWGLTLPSSVYTMDDVRQNIPKTLNVFRGASPQKPIRFEMRPRPDSWSKIAVNARFDHEAKDTHGENRFPVRVLSGDLFSNNPSGGICYYAGL